MPTEPEPGPRKHLRELCARRGVDEAQLAELARVSRHTAKSWLRSWDNAAARSPLDGLVELVCLKLRARPPRFM